MVVTACTMLATLMQGVDGAIANVALPYMQGAMPASQEQINWVLTSYIVASAIMTAPAGFLAARFGRMRTYVTAVVGFTLASVLCGMAQSLDQIVLFRIVQGMCGAALIPLAQVVLLDIYPLSQSGAMALDGEMTRQAAIIAYSDNFKLMFLATMITLPLVFLIRSPYAPKPVLGEEPLLE